MTRIQHSPAANPHRAAFTLIELLVVIGIIGVLIALTLPAVEMARESSRRSSCSNNLRQQALAIKLHTDAHGFFPTGGWGARWVGDPDSGFSTKQPGGWVYNTLPYLEQANLRNLGKGLQGTAKSDAAAQLMAMPLPILHCPSRRLARAYPYSGPSKLRNAVAPKKVAKSDYVISDRISFKKSEVIISEIQLSTGMSKTLLIGEKALAPSDYSTGKGSGDKLCMYLGHSEDISRKVVGKPTADADGGSGFGGPHPEGCNVAYCDGSVHFVLADSDLQPVLVSPTEPQ